MEENELTLFSEEEMRGGMSTDLGEVLVDSYLEAIRIVSSLNDEKFFALSHEYQPPKESQELYFLRSLPKHIMTSIQYYALGDCIDMHHAYDHYHEALQEPRALLNTCFEEAIKLFVDENTNGKYKYVKWIRAFDT